MQKQKQMSSADHNAEPIAEVGLRGSTYAFNWLGPCIYPRFLHKLLKGALRPASRDYARDSRP